MKVKGTRKMSKMELKPAWRINNEHTDKSNDMLSDLSEEQRAIVQSTDGNILVLSGAGSGKTRTLTYRVAYLLKQGVKPHDILCVTFTNKAAQEMKERITALTGITKARWWIGTFHGTCVRILVQYGEKIGIPSCFTIADEKEQEKELKAVLGTYENANIELERLQSIISWAKNNLIKPDELVTENEYCIDPVIGRIYTEYQERLKKMNTLDFDDLIMRTIDLLNTCPDVRERLQDQFKYILVDEAQDINTSEMELLRILSAKHGNLTLVGDDCQNIYSWRGATLDAIMAFAREPGTKIMKLEQNYRCSGNIVEASNAVIQKNKNRLEKTLRTDNPKGEKIVYYRADNEFEEARFVAGIIDYCCNMKRTHEYKDFAVLYRTNSQSRAIEDALSRFFIPYQIVNGTSFYERKEVKDTLAYLRLLINPRDVLSLQRIINEPKRGVGEASLRAIIDFIHENGVSCIEALERADEIKKANGKSALTAKTKENLKEMCKVFKAFIPLVKTQRPERLLKDFIVATGYISMLEEQHEEERIQNVYELANMVAAWYDENKEENPQACLEDFVKHLSLVSDPDNVADSENVVKLMTAHTAKGLEYRAVFIIGLEENIFPHFMAVNSNDRDIEEERRLFYVSMTRAKERLYLVNAEERYSFGRVIKNPPSRFIKEIPKHLITTI